MIPFRTAPSLSVAQQIAELNVPQRKAVEAPEAHRMISAGAGTGKTRVLTLRYAHLVDHYHVSPNAIAAVTFTNKASQEMKQRLRHFFPVHALWIGTFHSLSLKFLREHAEKFARSPQFTVLDMGDQQSLVQRLLKETASRKSYTPRMVMSAISAWKHKMLLPDQVTHASVPLYLSLYKAYQEQVQRMDAFDFDDLLLYSLKLFCEFPEVLATYPFKHILVDEYQDVNQMQYLWLKKLAEKGGFLFCVGDDDQSIYGWRGASIDNMLKFPQDFPDAEVICLEDNYRSTPHILSAASQLIAHNETRYGKVLRTDQSVGEKLHVQGLWDSTEEAAFIAQNIVQHAGEGEPLSSMAILVRTGAQTREFEERFMLQNIPYILVGNTRFYERMEIRDFLGYLRVIHSIRDNLAFERILNLPKRGIGAVTLQTFYAIAKEQGSSLEEAARLFSQQPGESAMKKSLSLFLNHLETWRSSVPECSPSELAERVLKESGYEAMWLSQGVQGEARIENLKELIKAMIAFDTLSDFLEHVSLLSEVSGEAPQEGVTLMTLHAAKGLEFKRVFLPGWEENMFPHIRCIEESGKKGLEEERRLAYVGITRARAHCMITFCWNRRGHQGFLPSTPSRFIHELPPEDVIISMKLAYSAKTASPLQQKRVMHAVFGKGTVQDQAGETVSVLFDLHGPKRIVARFLQWIKS